MANTIILRTRENPSAVLARGWTGEWLINPRTIAPVSQVVLCYDTSEETPNMADLHGAAYATAWLIGLVASPEKEGAWRVLFTNPRTVLWPDFYPKLRCARIYADLPTFLFNKPETSS